MLPYDNLTLTDLINLRRPVTTPVLDAHYTRVRYVPTETVQMDIIDGPEGIMVAISREAESLKAKRPAARSVTFQIPRFSEHDFITASDQIQYRAPGILNGAESFDRLVRQKLDDMRAKSDRTKEVMAIASFRGEIRDAKGNIIARYTVPDPVDINLATANLLRVFDDAKVIIGRLLGVSTVRLVAYCGVEAYRRLLENPQIAALLAGPMGPSLIENGDVTRVNGVELRRIIGVYVNEDGDEVPYFPDDELILVPTDGDFELIYGPCSAAGAHLMLIPYYVHQSDTDDPPATKLRVETNPLPIVKRPGTLYRLNSVSG